MRYILMLLCVCFFLACIVNTTKKFELPASWNKDLNITLYTGGGMLYASTSVYLYADSCKYIEMENGVDKIKRFKLTIKEQQDVLAKLNSYNVGAIETVNIDGIVHDKETNRLCFHLNAKDEHCIETGASTDIKPNYQKNFNEAYSYILALAKEKGK